MGQCPWGPGSLCQPRLASYHHSKHTTLLWCYISSSSVQPLPPTGHPEACWNTMPVLAQAPTSGPNVEVTSSGKNGIVSLEKHNTLETLISCKVLRRIQGREEFFFQQRPIQRHSKTCRWILSITYGRWKEVTKFYEQLFNLNTCTCVIK